MIADPADLLKAGDPEAALAALSAQVRAKPGDAKLRIFLFQLLCILGDWKRAVTQLKLCAELDPMAIPMAQAYREAIICEVFREKVFAGEKRPLIFGEPQDWIALQLESLQALAQGRAEQAADLRNQAYDAAPATSGTVNDIAFDWIADADSRLGPVLEAVIDGKYYWIPFNRIATLDLDPPEDLRDKVWMPGRLRFSNEGETVALIPTRYAGTVARGSGAAKLSLATDWVDAGGESWCGIGQRLLSYGEADLALMEVRSLRLAPGAQG